MRTTSYIFVLLLPGLVLGLSSSTTKQVKHRTTAVDATSLSKLTVVFDAAEWVSLQVVSKEEGQNTKPSKYGKMVVVVGNEEGSGERIVAMQYPDNLDFVYSETIAKVPEHVSDLDALSTFCAGMTSIHCTLPRTVDNIGGGSDSIIAGKAVILGGNDQAFFAARGLSCMGVDVSLVSSKPPRIPKKVEGSGRGEGKLNIFKPGDCDQGFSMEVGQFDSLLDTANDERPAFMYGDTRSLDGTLGLLESRHGCVRYVSLLSESQRIISKEGVIFGPGKVKEYAGTSSTQSFLDSSDCQPVPPLRGLGTTIEFLLANGILFPDTQRKKLYQGLVKGWNLNDFLEQSTWPRDSSGASSVRFGMPVLQSEEDMDDSVPLISAPPLRKRGQGYVPSTSSDDDVGGEGQSPSRGSADENPYVEEFEGVRGLNEKIVSQNSDAILFLSARFCKTCKTLNPQYTRMARLAKDKSVVRFMKAEASGQVGKELGRQLGVDSVPSFIFYKSGKRFGKPLYASKLPSPKISRAIEMLESGSDWDDSILEEE